MNSYLGKDHPCMNCFCWRNNQIFVLKPLASALKPLASAPMSIASMAFIAHMMPMAPTGAMTSTGHMMPTGAMTSTGHMMPTGAIVTLRTYSRCICFCCLLFFNPFVGLGEVWNFHVFYFC